MTCGQCEVCSCKAKTFSNKTIKFNSFQRMLAEVLGKVKYDRKNILRQPELTFQPDDFYIIKYNVFDKIFEVFPHYEFNDYSDIVDEMPEHSTGKVYDEHGKLLAAFEYTTKDHEFHREYIFDYSEFKPNKGNKIFTADEKSLELNIEDYKLKCLINRYISIIKSHGVETPKKDNYGSSNLDHILWMLYDILPMRRSLCERYLFLGYIQGVLKAKNIIDVKHERDIMHELL